MRIRDTPFAQRQRQIVPFVPGHRARLAAGISAAGHDDHCAAAALLCTPAVAGIQRNPGQIRHTAKGRFLIMPLTLKSSCRGAYHDAISCGFQRRQPVQGTDQDKGWRGTAG